MLTKNERMSKLNEAGIDTTKYFNISLPNGIKPGATISLVINENGQPVIVENKNDVIANQIIEDGYVRNTRLFRRFVMAQMFHALNYVSYDGTESGYNACLKNMYAYQYTLNMMLEEVRVLSKLEVRDNESFEERSHFFTKDVIVSVMCDYIEKLKAHVDAMPNKNCKGVLYKKIKNQNIFVADLGKKLYNPLMSTVTCVKYARSYAEIYKGLQMFMRDMIKLPYNTPKSKAWIDAYKGEGSYYTCKNLIMFHDCSVYDGVYMYGRDRSMYLLNVKLNEYKGEGWRMFAFMKKLIEDNEFDFDERIKEVYSK